MPQNTLESALQLASWGARVFPLMPGTKVPYPSFLWRDRASTDPDQIRQWWDRFPDANLAMVCDDPMVLDFDVKKIDGLATAARLFGSSWTDDMAYVRTPSGGAHVYAERVTAWGNRNPPGTGLDVQGLGRAYVVAPPSVLTVADQAAQLNPTELAEWRLGLRTLSVGCYCWRGAPTVYHMNAAQEAVMEALSPHGAGEAHADGGDGSLPDWEGVEVTPGAAGHLTGPRARFWTTGDASAWGHDRSAAVLAVALQLLRTAVPATQVLRLLMDNDHCAEPARARRGSDESAAEWLWRYTVRPAQVRVDAERLSAPEAFGDGAQLEASTPELGTPGSELEVTGHNGTVAPAAHAAVDAAMRAAQAVVPGDFDAIQRVLEGLVAAALAPYEVDYVLSALKTSAAVSLASLRASLRQVQSRVQAEERAARREDTARDPLIARYVVVESQGALYNRDTRGWVTPAAFGMMHGEENRQEYIAGGRLRRYQDSTYMPLNAWSPMFQRDVERTWLEVTDAHTGVTCLNTWRPPLVQPDLQATTADVRLWLRHLDRLGVLGSAREHLLDVMAFVGQHPQVKVNHMVVIGGGAGLGKGTLLEPLTALVGGENVIAPRTNVIDSDFDPDVSQAKVMVIEELANSDWDKRRARELYNKLKPYGAAPPARLSVVLKGRNAVEIPNIVQVFAQTNYRSAVVLDADDRRCFMVWCEGSPLDEADRNELWQWLEYGGREKVAGWLLQRDISAFDPKAPPPMTPWKASALEDSRSALEQSVAAVLEQTQDVHLQGEIMLLDVLLSAVRAYELEHGEGRNVTASRLASALDGLGIRRRRINVPKRGQLETTLSVHPCLARVGKKSVAIKRNVLKWMEAPTSEIWSYIESVEKSRSVFGGQI